MAIPVIAAGLARLAQALLGRGLAAELAEELDLLGDVVGSQVTVQVSSSFINSLTWDADTDTLTIDMRSGSYDYPGVSYDEFRAFAAAGSKGQHYNTHYKERAGSAAGLSSLALSYGSRALR